MNWEVKFTDRARRDLRNILEYIAHELKEPEIAVALIRTITNEILSLNQMPLRYGVYSEEPWKSQGLRWFPIKKYFVFYYANESENTVYVVRVFYGEQDISHQLNELSN